MSPSNPNPPRVRIGLTGGIGCGKSTVLEILQRHGATTAQADLLAREQFDNPEVLKPLRETFGEGIFGPEGKVDRAALGRIVFSSRERLAKLEALLHPAVRAAWQKICDEPHPLVVIEIPLLFEKNLFSSFDLTWCVAAGSQTRHQRLQARGWNDEQIAQREANQWTVAQKMQNADVVIWNEGSLAHLEAQVARALATPRA
ncbi:MAG: dephospho-CoA kinase [Verrucomicrobiota bacterium JB022]|nr:dephospho-CoA kinase [Verrucomicrobiota bacterium JB022]